MDKEFFNGMNLAEDISEEDFQYIKDGWENRMLYQRMNS